MPPPFHCEETRRLLAHYDQMWADSFARIRAGDIECDEILARGEVDQRRGMTLIVRPSADVRSSVGMFLEELRAIEPGQYFYPASDLHITVLPLFTAMVDAEPFLEKTIEYVAAVEAVLPSIAPIKIEFHGVSVSRAAVLVRGFPASSTLNDFRDRLRQELHARGLGGTVDSRYKLETAHMTVIRFRAPLRDSGRFAEVLEKAREWEFGRAAINAMQLVPNDWYMRECHLSRVLDFAV